MKLVVKNVGASLSGVFMEHMGTKPHASQIRLCTFEKAKNCG